MMCGGMWWQWLGVIAIAVAAVWLAFGRRRRGNSCCGGDSKESRGGCSGCPLAGGCQKDDRRDCDQR